MTPPHAPRVLLVEDDPAIARTVEDLLRPEDLPVITVERAEEALERVGREDFDLVLTDVRLPGMDGLALLDRLRALRPRCPVVVMTAHGSTDIALEATKRGAYDYLVKPFDPDELVELVSVAVERGRRASEPVALGEPAPGTAGPALVGRSRPMQALCKEIGRLAGTTLPVLILGETGTGKELVARALVQHGPRADRPFLAVNCAALPENLLESELFGHERGAFTGADRARIGRFEQAHGGTLFLDEIGDLAPATQAKLLRVLQDGSFRRVGGSETLRADVRILSATHRDLEREVVAGGGFREDLFFRLGAVVLRVPPLRERPGDIPILALHLLQRHAAELGIADPAATTEALDALAAHPWPGNVRQLENILRRALLLARPLPVGLDHVRRALAPPPGPASPAGLTHADYVAGLIEAARRGELTHLRERLIADLEPELFRQALQAAGGNQALAARWLGTSRRTVREAWRLLDSGDPGGTRPGTGLTRG